MTNTHDLVPVIATPDISQMAMLPPQQMPAPPQNPLLVVHALLRGRYVWAILLALVLGSVGAVVGYRIKPPTYQSTGLIQIRAVIPKILYATEQSSVMPMFDAFMESQVMLLKGERVRGLAMQNPEWRALKRGNSPATIQAFAGSLEVMRPKGSEMIVVSLSDPDPAAAAIGVKVVIDAYQKAYGDKDPDSPAERVRVLTDLRAPLAAQHKALTDRIKAIYNEFGSNKLEQIYEFKLQELNKLESERNQLRLMGASPGQGSPTTAPSTAATPPVAEVPLSSIITADPYARACVQRRDQARQELDRLRLTKGENHENVRAARLALDAAEASLNAAVADYRKAASEGTGKLAAAGLSLQQVQAKRQGVETLYSQVQDEVQKLGRTILDVEKLRDDAAQAKSKLDEITARIDQLNLEGAARVTGRVEVISSGDTPLSPEKDKRKAFGAAGGMGGGAVGFGVLLLIGVLDRRLRSVDDAQMIQRRRPRILGILPSLPDNAADPEQVMLAAHCVHHIRTMLQIQGSRDQRKVFAITSPGPGDGKTSLTLSLGLSFAASGAKALLVDCDVIGGGLTSRTESVVRRRIGQILLRRGLINEAQLNEGLRLATEKHRRIGEALVSMGCIGERDVESALSVQQESAVGLFDALGGEPLMDCVMEMGTAGVSVLPLGAVDPQHCSQVSPDAIRTLIDEARKHFDVILIDTGPVLGSLEAAVVAAASDEVVLTVSRGQQRFLAAKALEQLTTLGIEVAGIVFNRAGVQDVASSVHASVSSSRPVPNEGPAEATPASLARLGPVAAAVVPYRANGNGKSSRT